MAWNNYDATVGELGHYYHRHIAIPGALRLLNLRKNDALLDLGCGQGVLARALPENISYEGVDLSSALISHARRYSPQLRDHFHEGNISKPLLFLKKRLFTHAVFLFSLQNLEDPANALKQAAHHLQPSGILVIILNHPCFRIPRQSSWEIDTKQGLQYRRINRYLAPLKIPIQMHPGKGKKSPTSWSYHHPLSSYSRWLFDAGFSISLIEEWISDKKSTGKRAKMEDRARLEFPLFLAIKAENRN